MLIAGLVTAKYFKFHASSSIHNSAWAIFVTMLQFWNYRVQQPLAVKSGPSASQPMVHASVKAPHAMLQVIPENDLSRATVSLLWPAGPDPIWIGRMVQIFSWLTHIPFSRLLYSFMPQITDQVSYQECPNSTYEIVAGISSGQTGYLFFSSS